MVRLGIKPRAANVWCIQIQWAMGTCPIHQLFKFCNRLWYRQSFIVLIPGHKDNRKEMTTDADRRQDNAKQQQQTNPDKFSNNPPRDGPDSGDKSSNRSPDLISKTELVDANSKKSGQPRLHFGFSIENK